MDGFAVYQELPPQLQSDRPQRMAHLVLNEDTMVRTLAPLLADAGIPMIALTLPLMLILLIPVVVIEAFLCKRWLRLTNWDAMKSNAVANLVSTIVGVPLAWAIMLGLQFAAIASVDQRTNLLNSNSPLATAVVFLLHSAGLALRRATMHGGFRQPL